MNIGIGVWERACEMDEANVGNIDPSALVQRSVGKRHAKDVYVVERTLRTKTHVAGRHAYPYEA